MHHALGVYRLMVTIIILHQELSFSSRRLTGDDTWKYLMKLFTSSFSDTALQKYRIEELDGQAVL